MSTDLYAPGILNPVYDAAQLQEELRRIADTFNVLEVASIRLIEQHVAPTRLYEGLVVNADGTNWNPGSGAGIYAYVSGAWVKL